MSEQVKVPATVALLATAERLGFNPVAFFGLIGKYVSREEATSISTLGDLTGIIRKAFNAYLDEADSRIPLLGDDQPVIDGADLGQVYDLIAADEEAKEAITKASFIPGSSTLQ